MIKAIERKVWIFQGNPIRYRLYQSLCNENLKEAAWLVSRYRDEIHIGDIALIWKARYRNGIYAVGEVTSSPQEIYDLPESQPYWVDPLDRNKKALRVIIHYRLKLSLITALTSKELRAITELSHMEILTQKVGTNFKVRPSEWQIISDLLKRKYNFEIV
jgi:predicted RNA-binding protein with PUA-like domain